ncbi:vancomycin resistance protein YoaR [Kineococcus rhizosphaerae]|uniref:Vancomycin resistance protein YoaR n=1 Tax=Kineococcus rhizosphaerae TaxID=559628 RepID=A0A2T0R260_9ACTN|nr:vancomycin resistance protein YoaR [Kineococcus rhizosphaerae]
MVAGGYCAAALALGGQAPRGTTVLGQDVGGQDRAALGRTLGQRAQELQAQPVALALSGAGAATTAEVVPDRAGLAVDVERTADRLAGPAWTPAQLWRHVAGGSAVAPVVDVDTDAVRAALQPVADSVAVAPVEGAVTFDVRADGTVEPAVTDPVVGRALDLDAAAGKVADGWLAGGAVPLTVTAVQPAVDAAGIRAAVDAIARPAVAGDLVVAGGGRQATLAPAAFAPALAVRPVDGKAALVADGERLQAAVTAADPQFETPPQDARIEIVGDRPQVVPAVAGRAAPPADLAAAVTAALTGTSPTRRAEVALTQSQPALSTEELQSLGIVERISTFSTKLTADAKRTENIRIAARYVDGTILKPGEEFSLNDTVGERTPERGFNKAPVISGGKLVDDYGGGVSQLSTTLFNNVFFAGLDEIEHKPHSLYISRYPEGREATLDWRSIDNRFKNDSGHGVYIQAGVVGNQVVVSMYGTKFMDVESITSPRRNVKTGRTVYDTSARCTPNSTPHTGFTVDVTRVMTPVAGGPEQRETWTTVYNSDNRVVCGPDPSAPKPSATASAAPSAPAGTPAQ